MHLRLLCVPGECACMYTYIYTHTYICMCVSICCVCTRVCACVWRTDRLWESSLIDAHFML